MSVEQPSSGRPTGPPSGPLSGPSEPSPTESSGRSPLGPSGGDSGAAGGSGDSGGGGSGGGPLGPGGGGRGPERPWWRSAPRIAIIATAAVAAVALILVLTRPDGGSGSDSEVFLQAAGTSGPDPFTESTATDSSAPPETPAVTRTPTKSANVTRGVEGSAPGLYGGTRKVASCDVEKQIKFFQANSDKNEAFASAERIQPSEVPAYLRSLTPLQLRYDTRVTNHGYRNGKATPYQAVLQAGTAVLVDDRGVPRVRCACGNPLLPAVPQKSTPKPTGDSWPSYQPQNVVIVSTSTTIINVFVVFDPDHDDWFKRHKGDYTGRKDQKTDPPAKEPSPSISVSDSAPTSDYPSPCVTLSAGKTPNAPEDGASLSPCPPTSPSESSPSESESSPSESESSPSESESSPAESTETKSPPSDTPPDDTTSDTTTESAPGFSTPETVSTPPGS